jgi:hypothetical protein
LTEDATQLYKSKVIVKSSKYSDEGFEFLLLSKELPLSML